MPKKFFHTAGNFREHEEESKQVGWTHEIAPWIVFFQNVDALVGHDEPIVYPEHLTEELDYELELAVVLQGRQVVRAGRRGRLHRRLRDLQRHHCARHPAARDASRCLLVLQGDRTFCPLGPWIVTPDEIADPHDLAMGLRVNGEQRQESHSRRMSVTIPEILSHYSALGYSAGDVLSTGTVSGVAGFSPDAASLYLKPGDVMEAEIERIGVLRNPVVSWQEATGSPRRRACVGSVARMNDEFRVEVELDDAERGYSFGERLRALDSTTTARERLGEGSWSRGTARGSSCTRRATPRRARRSGRSGSSSRLTS